MCIIVALGSVVYLAGCVVGSCVGLLVGVYVSRVDTMGMCLLSHPPVFLVCVWFLGLVLWGLFLVCVVPCAYLLWLGDGMVGETSLGLAHLFKSVVL